MSPAAQMWRLLICLIIRLGLVLWFKTGNENYYAKKLFKAFIMPSCYWKNTNLILFCFSCETNIMSSNWTTTKHLNHMYVRMSIIIKTFVWSPISYSFPMFLSCIIYHRLKECIVVHRVWTNTDSSQGNWDNSVACLHVKNIWIMNAFSIRL